MTNKRAQRLIDAIRAAAVARDLQPEEPYTYHFSSDTYEEETLLLIDEQKLQQNEDGGGNPVLGESEVGLVQIDTAAAAANDEISPEAEKQEADAVHIVVHLGSSPQNRSKSSSDAEKDNTNGEMDETQTDESLSHRTGDESVEDDELATTSSTHKEKTNHPAATKIIHQGQEEMMTNSIDVGRIDATNGPFGLPIYAWGIIGVAGLAIVVVVAMVIKRRRKAKRERRRECDDQRAGAKRRVAIDYGGGGDDVDVEELSVVSNISSLSGGTFVVRHDRV